MDEFVIKSSKLEYIGEMPANKREALELSIRKWRFIQANHKIVDEDGGTRTCGLCMLYYHNREKARCEGCPVAAVTRMTTCIGSPYHDYHFADTFLEEEYAISAEIAFLERLREK